MPIPPEWEGKGGKNVPFLTERGHAQWTAYGSALGKGLRARLAPAAQRAVLVSMQNEMFLEGDTYPYSSHNTTVTVATGTASGRKFDMAEPAQRQVRWPWPLVRVVSRSWYLSDL